MKTAVIYARYSSDNQTEQSIDGQLRVCTEYAKSHDILILNTYIDRAMTGTNDNRPDFRRMLADSGKREWDYVLVYKLDRFSRDKYETAIHKNTLKNNGVKVLSATENIPDTPEGIILESLLEGMSAYYSAELSQKVKRGMNETRLKGNFTGGFIIYGYKVVDRKIVIDDTKADIVRYIFEQYSLGVYVKDIIAELNARGITNKGKPFARNTVYNILRNEKYSGIFRHNDEVFENIYPRIISDEIYRKVRAKIDANKYGKRSVKVVYLLKGKLFCGYCGMPITAETGTAKNGTVKHYYKCIGRKKDSDCKKSVIRKDFLEQFVIENIVKELSQPETMNTIVKSLLAFQDKQCEESSALNMLLREQRANELSINNMLNAIENGVITNSTTKRLKELENKQEQLERQILIEKSKTTVKLSEKEICQFYIQALKCEPQMLINLLVEKVVLFDDKCEIHYNSPIAISPDESRGFCFIRKYVKIPTIIDFAQFPVLKDILLEMYV